MNFGSSIFPTLRRLTAVAVGTVILLGFASTPAGATPMPSGQEARIVAEATEALDAIGRYADRRDVDAYDLYQ